MKLKDLKDEIEQTMTQEEPSEQATEKPTEDSCELSDGQCETISGGRVGDHKPPT